MKKGFISIGRRHKPSNLLGNILLSESENPSNSVESQRAEFPAASHEVFWAGKFVLTNIVILVLALLAGYLQYVAYPALMTGAAPPNGTGFGESNVVLSLSFLTFQLSATNPNCLGGPCFLRGVQAFDFCQALVYLVILVNLARFVRLRWK